MKAFGILIALLSCIVSTNAALIAAYWGSWSVYRSGIGQFTADKIPSQDLDILYYAFAGIDETAFTIKSVDPWADLSPSEGGHYDCYRKAVSLKQQNPQLEVLLSVGGWQEGSVSFSAMASSANLRKTFIDSVVPYLQKYGFDGLDLDWEYPAERGGSVSDKDDFSLLLQELSSALRPANLKLSVALGGFKDQIDISYDFLSFVYYVDYFNGMTYTYYTYYDYHEALPSSALYPKSPVVDENHSVNFTINYYIQNGVPPQKLFMGIITSAETFTLENSAEHGIGSSAINVGQQGPFTVSPGILATYEVCDNLRNHGYSSEWDDETELPYAYGGNQWVSYENDRSVMMKAQYALENNLAGVAIWTVDLDDTSNICSSRGGGYLLNAIKSVLHG